jgi:hypothetical protein
VKQLLKFWPVLVILATIASTAIGIDTRYAKDTELAMVKEDFTQFKIEQTRDDTQKRLWDIQDRLDIRGLSKDAKEDLEKRKRELKDQLDKLDKKLKKDEK